MQIEGSGRLKTVIADYDFAVDGGAVGTINLRGDNTIPAGAYILGGLVDVTTAVTSGGAATVGVNSNASGDIVAAAAVSGAPWSTTGLKSVVPSFTGATAIKTTAQRSLAITIGTAALTAGKFRVTVYYQ
jgi:hypothetical protein